MYKLPLPLLWVAPSILYKESYSLAVSITRTLESTKFSAASKTTAGLAGANLTWIFFFLLLRWHFVRAINGVDGLLLLCWLHFPAYLLAKSLRRSFYLSESGSIRPFLLFSFGISNGKEQNTIIQSKKFSCAMYYRCQLHEVTRGHPHKRMGI